MYTAVSQTFVQVSVSFTYICVSNQTRNLHSSGLKCSSKNKLSGWSKDLFEQVIYGRWPDFPSIYDILCLFIELERFVL